MPSPTYTIYHFLSFDVTALYINRPRSSERLHGSTTTQHTQPNQIHEIKIPRTMNLSSYASLVIFSWMGKLKQIRGMPMGSPLSGFIAVCV